jgi:NitT/TauT family transport system substrate-binding protein
MKPWIKFAAAGLALALAGTAQAAPPEKKDVSLGVGGKNLLYYLPLTIAERKGYFTEEGLNVTINDFRGGSQSLQALQGGSVDVVTGAYEHTIRMQVKGRPVIALIELGRFPGIVLGVKTALKDKVKTPGDLKGMKIGVTAPGSSTNNFVNFLLAKDGVKSDEVSIVGVGAGPTAVAAVKKGDIDAISNLEPVISTLIRDDSIYVLADTRTEEGSKALFGGNSSAAVLYATPEFIARNPETTQRLVNAFHKALKWIAQASGEDVAATVPEDYYLSDRALYVEAVKASLPTYSRNGIITEASMKAAQELLSFDPEVASAKVDLPKTFDGSFIAQVDKPRK